jgi:hypothetical protein
MAHPFAPMVEPRQQLAFFQFWQRHTAPIFLDSQDGICGDTG